MIQKELTRQAVGAKILLIDEDPIILENLSEFLEQEGYDVSTAATGARGLNYLQSSAFNVVIADADMTQTEGLELLRHIKDRHDGTAVIMMTGYGTIASAVETIRRGAYDYLVKPIADDDVRTAVKRVLRRQKLLAENSQTNMLSGGRGLENVIGADFHMAKVFDLINAVADSRSTVLITGESGTGKSVIARAIHARSPRRRHPFVEVSCGALPETLLESELFGHVRGAFTDAVADKPGKFAVAEHGTIFLDEISSASPRLQVKLLRVLQERRFEPVGGNETQEVDVRVILATNHDLWQEVQAGRFRKDLYYRVNVVNIEVPPLRQRVDDIPLLAEHFLHKFLAEDRTRKSAPGRDIRGFSPEAMDRMRRYAWPGNVRELENCIERAVVLCRGAYIDCEDLPPAVLDGTMQRHLLTPVGEGVTLQQALAEPERRIIFDALQANDGNRRATADQLGINRTTLYKKMKKYSLLGKQ
ncbi:MAG: sigma-54 dependent transcriptional regulator [Planctomycetota bacterium]|nr:sigma-54 dependent transcriptional regulator [Planctomycetota bacterium]